MNDFIIDAWRLGEKAEQLDKPNGLEANTWLHFQRDTEGLKDWLLDKGLDHAILEAVLREDTRPRFQRFGGDNFLLIIRGVNLNPGEQPDDMLSLRILYYQGCLLTFRKFPFRAIAYVQEQLKTDSAPQSIEEALLTILDQIHRRIEETLEAAEERLDILQEQLEDASKIDQDQIKLTTLHRQLLKLNRFLKPQPLALADLYASQISLVKDEQFAHLLLNQKDIIARILESLEAHLEHAWVLREHILQHLSEKMNRNTYNLSLVAGIFMPLGFMTGLLGINLGGIPGADSPWGFTTFCGLLISLGVLEFFVLKRFKYW